MTSFLKNEDGESGAGAKSELIKPAEPILAAKSEAPVTLSTLAYESLSPSPETVKANLLRVRQVLPAFNSRGEAVTLVAATKFVSAAAIAALRDLGVRDVGDNKVQEFLAKTSKIDGVTYHFIGRLQKNKVKYVVGKCALIHSVDSVDLARVISRRAEALSALQDILLEVNTGEVQKAGFSFEDVFSAVKEIAALPCVRVRGLMAMLPETAAESEKEKICLRLREIYDTLKREGYPFTVLSLGMSGDYALAVRCGSNLVRLGTALFGKRDYSA